MRKAFLLGLILSLPLFARDRAQGFKNPVLQPLDRPPVGYTVLTLNENWTRVSNHGQIGDPAGAAPSFSWPGGTPGVNNYYLWDGRLWIGAEVNGRRVVTHYDYGEAEWLPSDPAVTGYPVLDNGFVFNGPGKSAYDAVAIFDDFLDNDANSGGHTGLQVIMRAMVWPHEPYNDLVAFEYFIIYHKDQCDLATPPPDTLTGVIVSWNFDADVSGADATDPHIDDLVSYDGWTNGEWDNPNFIFRAPVDELTILRDGTVIEEPDGVPDQYFVWGDDPDEQVVEGGGYPITIRRNGQEITINGYLIPRNVSFIYDGDNPAEPGDDTGEGGASAGYIGGILVYAPPSPNDLTADSVSGVDRIVRPLSHQWWNWEADPPNDEARYAYMAGEHPATYPYRFAPHPFDLRAAEFDYRFLLSAGPYNVADGETLKVVFVGAVGQGLNGGVDNYWRNGQYVLGLRHMVEWAFKAYYSGCENGDPAHPDNCPPVFGGVNGAGDRYHWKIPVPPPSPTLFYTATDTGVQLVWDNRAEVTPDPLKGVVDFMEYRVYRAVYGPSNWELLAVIRPDEQGRVAHTYFDRTALPGFPYFYVVTAVDEDSLESAKDNFKKNAVGAPQAIVLPTKEHTVEDVIVVPNPYITPERGTPLWVATEIEDKIEFQNLPPSCVIRIYTFSGDLVKVIYHNSGTGSESWDLINRNGQKVAAGIYLAKIQDPEGNYKIVKFAILR